MSGESGTHAGAGGGTGTSGEGTDGAGGTLRRVAVVGAGLVGGSVARAAVDVGVEHVVLTDHDPEVRARARDLGLAHEVLGDLGRTVRDAELVVVAIPSHLVPAVIQDVSAAAPIQAIITDVSSLKSQLVPQVEAFLVQSGRNPARFVGGHPMAGSEDSGPEAADGSMFQGATWVLTPTERTDHRALQALSGFLRDLGARVLALPPDRHDALVAVVSHLPQVAASCLADVAGDAVATSGQAVLAVAGGGFRDTTRIAASDARLWRDILEGNRPAVLDALDRYRTRLDEVRAALEGGDGERLMALLERASRARRQLVAKERPDRLVDVVVPLDDRPGALAATTTALGEAGINIEDLAMRHAAAGDRGALLVRVEEAAARRALEVLEQRGTHAHLEDGEI
jgi:prephenate dehydrogenase